MVMPMLTLVESSAERMCTGSATTLWRRVASTTASFLAHVAGEDRELVAAEARYHVRGTELRGDALAEHDEELVACAVSEAVVDRLEAVAVEEQHREAEARILARRLDRALQLLEEVRAVRKVGEVVVVRDVLQAALGDAARGHVLHLENEDRRVLVGDGEERRRVAAQP
jgi:hypothetical protein